MAKNDQFLDQNKFYRSQKFCLRELQKFLNFQLFHFTKINSKIDHFYQITTNFFDYTGLTFNRVIFRKLRFIITGIFNIIFTLLLIFHFGKN